MLSNPDPVDDMESLDEGTKADDENDSTDKNNQTSGESDLEKGSVIMCCQKLSYGILLPKLFWPTVRKNRSSDGEKLLKFKAEGQEIAKILR